MAGRGRHGRGSQVSVANRSDVGSMTMGGESRILGACPMDCPDTCSWVVTVKDGRAVRLQGDPNAPVHARRPVRQAQRLRRVHPVAGSAALSDAAASVPRGAAEFERISWDEALDEIAGRLDGIDPRIRRRGDLALRRLRQHGAPPGRVRAGRRLWNVLGASHHLMTICTIAGGVGTGYTLGDNRVGMDPETLRFSKLIILWGSNTLTTQPSSLAQHRHGPPGRRSPRRDRPGPDPDRRGRRHPPGADSRARTPRWRSAS